jgi:Aldo/keto reductase family
VAKYLNERGLNILKALDAVGAQHQARPAEIALAWLMAREGVTAPIASATSIAQVESFEPRELFRHTLTQCMSNNPASIRCIVALMALYLHVGPFSREVITRIDKMLVSLSPGPGPSATRYKTVTAQ